MSEIQQLQSKVEDLSKKIDQLRLEIDLLHKIMPTIQGKLFPQQEQNPSESNLKIPASAFKKTRLR